jgi:hypothetical protein
MPLWVPALPFTQTERGKGQIEVIVGDNDLVGGHFVPASQTTDGNPTAIHVGLWPGTDYFVAGDSAFTEFGLGASAVALQGMAGSK